MVVVFDGCDCGFQGEIASDGGSAGVISMYDTLQVFVRGEEERSHGYIDLHNNDSCNPSYINKKHRLRLTLSSSTHFNALFYVYSRSYHLCKNVQSPRTFIIILSINH